MFEEGDIVIICSKVDKTFRRLAKIENKRGPKDQIYPYYVHVCGTSRFHWLGKESLRCPTTEELVTAKLKGYV